MTAAVSAAPKAPSNKANVRALKPGAVIQVDHEGRYIVIRVPRTPEEVDAARVLDATRHNYGRIERIRLTAGQWRQYR